MFDAVTYASGVDGRQTDLLFFSFMKITTVDTLKTMFVMNLSTINNLSLPMNYNTQSVYEFSAYVNNTV